MSDDDRPPEAAGGGASTGSAASAAPAALVGRAHAAVPFDARDRPWLALALLPACAAVAVYLATNPYPAYGAGLYAAIAEAIVANGYAPPTSIDGYTAGGVPFAYPPLQFYVLAVLLDLGADPVVLARLLPPVAVVAVSVPAYLLGRDLTGSRPGGAAAAAALALNPQVLQWHVSAGGVVRGFAFLYAVTSVYAGYRAQATGSRRALAVAAAAFGLTVLTHPTYTLFAVAGHVVLWVALDRSPTGLLRGLAVGLGGAALAAPWLAWAVATHGPTVFAAAAGTHGGIGGGADALLGGLSAYTLVPLAAAAYLLARRRLLLPLWAVVAQLLFRQPRFLYAVGAFALAAVAVDLAGRFPERRVPTLPAAVAGRSLPTGRNGGRAALAAGALVAATAVGGAALGAEMTLTADPSTPEFLDDADLDAMAWVEAETPSDATFVVAGDAAEWFPLLTDRTILIGPWGVEWRDPEAYYDHRDAFVALSTCDSAACVEGVADSMGASPTYVYVPKGHYTVRGHPAVSFGTLDRSFSHADGWTRAYENGGVAVYRATDARANASTAGRTGSERRGAGPPPR